MDGLSHAERVLQEAGILDVTRPRSDGACSKAAADPLTLREREETRRVRERERKRKSREEQRQAAVANGTHRRPGRPKAMNARAAPATEPKQ